MVGRMTKLWFRPTGNAFLELDPELADKDLFLSRNVGKDPPLAPEIFKAGVDKCYWTPDHVDIGGLQAIVGHG